MTVSYTHLFATEPELLLMDEPYGQLDIELRFRLEDELVKLWQMTKTTAVSYTHLDVYKRQAHDV